MTPVQPEPWQTEWVLGRTKHDVDVKYLVGTTSHYNIGLAKVAPVSSNENLSDIGTKRVPGDRTSRVMSQYWIEFR